MSIKTHVQRTPKVSAVHFMDDDGVMVSVGFPNEMLLVTGALGPNGKPTMLAASKCSYQSIQSNAEAYMLGKIVGGSVH